MFKRPVYIAIIGALLLVLVAMNLPPRAALRLKVALAGLFLPLFGLGSSSQNLAAKARQAVVPRQTLVAQNEQLQQENQVLRLQAQQNAELLKENTRLSELLAYTKQHPRQYKLARVIGRDPANWWRSIHIDRGSRDGMKINLTVLTLEGLAGRIAEVGLNRSLVLLVGDPNCRVAALVQQKSETGTQTVDTTGVIVPNSGDIIDNAVVDLTFLSRHSNVVPGQTVYTSGQGGIFPKGIRIGQIMDCREMEYGLYLEARVKLAVDFVRLEEVFVILP